MRWLWRENGLSEPSQFFTIFQIPFFHTLYMVLLSQLVMMFLQPKSPNPFAKDSRVPRKPYIHDQHKRDKVLKQGFSQAKVGLKQRSTRLGKNVLIFVCFEQVPENLDAIVIGSGIGGIISYFFILVPETKCFFFYLPGLTTAAVMAKAGKKVLVLEQHDQAGGCCHTFLEKVQNIVLYTLKCKTNYYLSIQ